MANPPIQILRAPGWTEEEWVATAVTLNQARFRAEVGIQDLGVQYSIPKVGSAEKTEPDEEYHVAGRAKNAQEFTLKTIKGKNSRRSDYTSSAGLSCTIYHEVWHCLRMEDFAADTIIELAATEGLAYLAEDQFIERYCGGLIVARLSWLNLIPDRQLADEFILYKEKDCSDIDAINWFDSTTPDALRTGALFGAQRVAMQLDRGYTLPDLLRQPAEDVLGL